MVSPVLHLTEQSIRAMLPQGFLEVVGDLVSAQGMLALIMRRGGESLVIPRRPGPESSLRDVLSDDDFTSLCRGAGGCGLYVPFPHQLRRYLKALAMVDARQQGQSIKAIAREHRLSMRSVWRLIQWYRDQQELIEST